MGSICAMTRDNNSNNNHQTARVTSGDRSLMSPVVAEVKMEWGEKIGIKGVTPSKTHRFGPICLPNMNDILILLKNSSFS